MTAIVKNNKYYGAHLSCSAKNGIISAIDEINNVGGNMIQIFISNPMSTKYAIDTKKFSQNNCNLIKQKLIETNSKIVIHLPYVINLAKPLDPNIEDSYWISIICKQLIVSDSINSLGCVVHVGKHLALTPTEGTDNMYDALKYIIEFIKSNNLNTFIILETGAGQGSELLTTKNNSLEEFANFYNRFSDDDKEHIRICVDTCHIFAAGYDITNIDQVDEFFDDFNSSINLKYMALIHLNDSKKICGSCVDRHENLGFGKIGITGLTHFIKHALNHNIPLILETPNGYVSELLLINSLNN